MESWPKAEAAAAKGCREGRWHWLGRVPFAETASLQEATRVAIREGRVPETLFLLEHQPVITLGKSAAENNVLQAPSALASRGIALHRASRGGDVTYHGPGQLVGYPLVRLRRGIRAHVEGMAHALIAALAELAVSARYKREAPGLWVDADVPGGEAKICAFGVNVHHRITMHGFALNLSPDLDAFRLIVPCGLAGCQVTSVAALTRTQSHRRGTGRPRGGVAGRPPGRLFPARGRTRELHCSARSLEWIVA